MSSEHEAPAPVSAPEDDDSSKSISKKAAKKEAAKQEKLRRRQEAAAAATVSSLSVEDEGPVANNYGDVPTDELKSLNTPQGNWSEAVFGKKYTLVGDLIDSLKDQEVIIRGRVHTTRPVSSKLTFVVVRKSGFTVQCVVTLKPDSVSKQMVKFVASLNRESIVDVIGVVSVPGVAIKGASQQVLLYVTICLDNVVKFKCESAVTMWVLIVAGGGSGQQVILRQ